MAGRDEADRVERRSSRDPLVGTVINGKFHVKKAIARGGMGRIYYGTQAPLDRPVALKIVKADSINEEESQFLKRFLLEASILAKLQHPNVVTLFDYGRIEGAPVEMYFIAMEYLDGETLTERLRTRGALPAFEALTLFRQLARGLREAHVRGIVHRDLKPSNIVIVPEADGEIVKLVDFGIGKDERGGEDLTRDGVLVGTPKYMAPEQFDGASSPASDVYALGIIVFQILTGGVPFVGNTMAEFMIAKLQHPIPAMRDVNPISDASEMLESLVYRMLARRVEERPTLDEVFNHLAVCEEELFGASGARLALTGSNRHLGASSRPLSIGGFPAPYIPSAPHSTPHGLAPPSVHPHAHPTSMTPPPGPGMATYTPRPAFGGGPIISGMTPRPMAASAPPPAAAKSGVPALAVLGIVFVALTVAGSGLWFARARLSGKDPSTTTLSVPSATGAGSTASAAVSGPSTIATSFVLQVDSTPSGATVLDDGKPIGVTPLDIPIETVTFTQGASETNVRQSVTLAPETARTVKSPPSHATGGAGRPPGNSGSKPPPGPTSDSDIRLKR
ncbi:MAG: protein kinase [Labilithrix sp.]|nr:protein kinase [Labilithrix sp.]